MITNSRQNTRFRWKDAQKLSDNTVIQVPIPAEQHFDTVRVIHGVDSNSTIYG